MHKQWLGASPDMDQTIGKRPNMDYKLQLTFDGYMAEYKPGLTLVQCVQSGAIMHNFMGICGYVYGYLCEWPDKLVGSGHGLNGLVMRKSVYREYIIKIFTYLQQYQWVALSS